MDSLLTNYISPYYIKIFTLVGIYIIIALGLNFISGVTGQLSFGHAAFVSIGAYTAAILTTHWQVSFLLSLLAGGILAALVGILLGFPILRLTGDYLGIATLGFGEIVIVAFQNMKITGGTIGLAGITKHTSLSLVVIVVIFTIWSMYRLENSRFGRALMAIREDEIAANVMGINTTAYKIQAFGIGTFFAGIGGGLYAHMIQYLNPTDFGFSRSFDYLTFVVLGGLGSIPGTVLGTTILTLAPEFLRFVAQYRMMIYGALMVIMMIFRPRGLLGGVNLSKTIRALKKQKKTPLPGDV